LTFTFSRSAISRDSFDLEADKSDASILPYFLRNSC